MRVIKHTQNAVILRVKAHYCVLYAYDAKAYYYWYYGRSVDMILSEIFSANLKINEYRLGLGLARMKIAR